MTRVIFKGEEAIHYAEAHGLFVNEYETDTHGPRSGLTVDEARRIQDSHSGHVWVEADILVNSAEPEHH